MEVNINAVSDVNVNVLNVMAHCFDGHCLQIRINPLLVQEFAEGSFQIGFQGIQRTLLGRRLRDTSGERYKDLQN